MNNYARVAARFKTAKHPRTSTPRVSSGSAFIVRLTHRTFHTVDFRAVGGNVALAELTPNRWEAWHFPTPSSAVAAVRLALGLRLRDFLFEILPVATA